ncbi:U3 small nucleolar RNA-associated protein [Mycena sanguinolenta]|uniref:U3 small nucleolar RNA-associated protein n=1 Tax=Mycena sanguinolenta TaxID=230812 RepID=A0A8H7CIF4_9AGAR|nr:U3 small nucleolar RNA-associated protein [Mycena sanguinolenta]
MSSLKNILNPERRRSVKLLVPEQASSSWAPPVSLASPGSSSEDDQGEYNPLIHIPHPDCPDSLACLPDTDGRPQHTLPVILRCAILGSPRKRLTIREIYAAMEEKYAYYKTAGATWKQSVRHHLSLNRLFERQPRPATDPGFGSYWTVNLLAPPGTKRPRKRGRPNKDGTRGPKKDDPPPEPQAGPSSTKPKRGRPRRDEDSPAPGADLTPPIVPLIEPLPVGPQAEPSIEPLGQDDDGDVNMGSEDELVDELESHSSDQEDECESEEKLLHPFERRQSLSGGLTPYDSSAGFHFPPPDMPLDFPSQQPIIPSPQLASPYHVPQIATPPQIVQHIATPQQIVTTSPRQTATPHRDLVVSPHHTSPHPTASPHPVPSPHRTSPHQNTTPHLPASPPRQNMTPRLIASPPQSSYHSSRQYSPDSAHSEDIVERLQMEMANLRRQSAEAISMSMQLSDQLARAQAEVSETQSALELLESKLREETNKRMQAERTAEDALRLRRAAEEALKSMRFHPGPPR